jgi:Beta-galactosidase
MMKATGITVVCISESTWGTLEPKPGVFDFSHVDRVLDAWTRPLSRSSPVIKPELLAHGDEFGEALAHGLRKSGLNVRSARLVGLGLIVELVADDESNDDPLRSLTKSGFVMFHVLAAALRIGGTDAYGRVLESHVEDCLRPFRLVANLVRTKRYGDCRLSDFLLRR